ncbi:glycine oxidase ThiO, partial [Pseudomonas aeruginosa]
VGLYWLALDDQIEALQSARKHPRPLKEVPIEAAYAAVPGLGAGFQRAVYMSGVATVRAPRLPRSLRASLQQFANIDLHEPAG